MRAMGKVIRNFLWKSWRACSIFLNSSSGLGYFFLSKLYLIVFGFIYILNRLYDGKGQQPFEEQLRSLLRSIVELTSKEVQHLLLIQGACLRYLPSAVQDLIKVFDARELRYMLIVLINLMIFRLVQFWRIWYKAFLNKDWSNRKWCRWMI